MRCSRGGSCSRVFIPALTFKAPGLYVGHCATLFPVSPFVHPEGLVATEQSRIPSLSVFRWARALRRSGMGVLHVGVGVGAGDAKADVIYTGISFIVSVQYIEYLISYRDKVQEDNRLKVYSARYDNLGRGVLSPPPWE